MEKIDHNCSFSIPGFWGYLQSDVAKTNIINELDDTDKSFQKIIECQNRIQNFTVWRQLFISAIITSIFVMIVFKKPWNDDWFFFVLTIIIFFVSYLFSQLYYSHILSDRHYILTNNLFELKKRITK